MFVLRHKEVLLSREDVIKVVPKVKGAGRSYFALVKGKKLPVKRLLYQALKSKGYNFSLLDFTTADAVRILTKLGIEITHEDAIGTGESLMRYAGALDLGGNAVEDERSLYDTP